MKIFPFILPATCLRYVSILRAASFCFCFLSHPFSSEAQDVHYTMFSFSPANLNPALTGLFGHDHTENDLRVACTYRNQWRSIRSPYVQSPTPYNTFTAASDFRLKWLRVLKYNELGLGAMLYRDQSGDLNFGTTQFAWNAAFLKSIGKNHRDFLSFGLQQALVRRSIDFSNAKFDNQWNGKTFDPTLGSGENLPSPVFFYTDMNAGIAYNHRPKKGTQWTTGAALFHYNKPKQSFYINNFEVTLKPKFLWHGSALLNLSENFLLYPTALFMKQGQATESNLLIYGGKRIQHASAQARLGLGYRLVGSLQNNISSDAFLMSLWIILQDWDFGFSYDTNLSALSPATQLRGATEIFIVWHRHVQKHKSKYQKFRKKVLECPDDIMLNN
ncbi:MAG: PorP/SprF family type IX secretion system membrane protein [Cytophagaceae bacterium]|nr:PorP/SprF family type IX secretion system membrane protein [Cytophagaceae bacterium]MDW8455697.1 PorP/SprF family type IX secretion system membrane protein [Cytophagaceae bacterium]